MLEKSIDIPQSGIYKEVHEMRFLYTKAPFDDSICQFHFHSSSSFLDAVCLFSSRCWRAAAQLKPVKGIFQVRWGRNLGEPDK